MAREDEAQARPQGRTTESEADAPERRSHAERSAQTRARILQAVVDSISDVGFRATTATEIAKRAGVTWGAVQHHFGGKDGILAAVLENTLARFAERLADVPTSGTPIEDRVSQFIDRCWEHYRSPHYRSTFEILLNLMPSEDPESAPNRQLDVLAEIDRIWVRIFCDSDLSQRERLVLESYTVAVLSGLASHVVLAGRRPVHMEGEIELLKSTLTRELGRRAGGEN